MSLQSIQNFWQSNNCQLYKLSLAMVFGFPIAPTVILVGGFIGHKLAPSGSLATLPVAVVIIGSFAGIIPANFISNKIGRKLSFVFSTLYAQLACVIAIVALYQEHFFLFNFSCFMLGNALSFIHQYRFAAVELLPSSQSATAISKILIGGVFGGIIAPIFANQGAFLFSQDFVGSFLCLCLMNFLAFLVLLSYKHKKVKQDKQEVNTTNRSLLKIITQAKFISAVLVAAFGYGLMSLLMTAAPLSMKNIYNIQLPIVALVIQTHLIAMYLPSLFSGLVVKKIGVFKFICLGFFLNFISYAVGYFNQLTIGFWIALFFLGVGWNFLFVGGTYLLTKSYYPAERFKVQATNDFIVFGIQALGSLSSGFLLFYFNWRILNQISFFILATVLVFFLMLLFFNKRFNLKIN